MDSNIYDEIYDDYINNIIDISSMSDKDHFIFYNFKIDDSTCFDDIYMLNKDGVKGEFGHKNFAYTEEFFEKFLKALVIKFSNVNTITSKEVIYDNSYTFKMITSNRDIFVIEGLSEEKSNELMKLFDKKEEKFVFDNSEGKVNYLLLVFIAVLILLIISILVLF